MGIFSPGSLVSQRTELQLRLDPFLNCGFLLFRLHFF